MDGNFDKWHLSSQLTSWRILKYGLCGHASSFKELDSFLRDRIFNSPNTLIYKHIPRGFRDSCSKDHSSKPKLISLTRWCGNCRRPFEDPCDAYKTKSNAVQSLAGRRDGKSFSENTLSRCLRTRSAGRSSRSGRVENPGRVYLALCTL